MTAQEAVNKIAEHIVRNGGIWSMWYVGITYDYNQRLFNEHKADKNNGVWVCCPCDNANEARIVERHFLEKRECKGGLGGGDDTANWVYAYKITPYTVESV